MIYVAPLLALVDFKLHSTSRTDGGLDPEMSVKHFPVKQRKNALGNVRDDPCCTVTLDLSALVTGADGQGPGTRCNTCLDTRRSILNYNA
jgi:hypothetical protein